MQVIDKKAKEFQCNKCGANVKLGSTARARLDAVLNHAVGCQLNFTIK